MTPGAITRVNRAMASEYFVLGLCGVVFVAFAPFTAGFASPANQWNVLISCLPLLVLATGQTLVLVAGGIDLSVTAIIGLSSVVGSLVMSADKGWMAGHSMAMPVAVLAMLATGGLVGFLNGVCIAWLRMPAFMVTLTTTMFFNGFAIWLAKKAANAESIYNLPTAFLALGSQAWLSALLGIAVALFAHALLERTLLGAWFKAVGHNSRAAYISGVPVGRVTVSAYVLSGLFAATAAMLLTARLETGSPNHGKALLLDVIGAAVIGGTSLFGGKGRVAWTLYGVLFLSLLGNGLNLLNLSDFMITIIKGMVILVAALLDVWRSKGTSQI